MCDRAGMSRAIGDDRVLMQLDIAVTPLSGDEEAWPQGPVLQ